jgi:hypothetical protein
MAVHRPTLGSRLRVLRNWLNKRECACGRVWPCPAAVEGDRWRGGDPVPDSAGASPAPADFILNGKELFRLERRDRGERWRPS